MLLVQKLRLLWIFGILALSISTSYSLEKVHAQLVQTDNSSNTDRIRIEDSMVSLNASIRVEVDNQSLKTKNVMLGSAVVALLSTGQAVLKTPDSSQPIVKTQINNQINNSTQSVEGTEATNAILGIELLKALNTVNSSSYNQNEPGVITVDTSSTCEPSVMDLISCDNSIIMK
jgi:hypothetical protein